LLRHGARFESIPVIICTGDSRTSVVSTFVGCNIAGFIKKPFRPERLLKDVLRVLAPSAPRHSMFPRADGNAGAAGVQGSS
jgi:DNA-binding NtrC family response regulator